MSELTKHGIHSNIKIPPESSGARVKHTVFYKVAVSGLTVPSVQLPWDVTTATGISGFIVGYGDISGTLNTRIDITLREDSVASEFDIGQILTITGTGVSLTCTVVSYEKMFSPSITVSSAYNPNNSLNIDSEGSVFVRFIEGNQQIDPKGLTRVSTPTAVLDVGFLESSNSTAAYATIVGAATETFLGTETLLALDLTSAAGDSITKRSNRYAFFQTGFASIIETFVCIGDTGKANVVRRWGYFDDNNGVYFELDGTSLYIVIRSSTSGVVVNTRVAQPQWNHDTLDGTAGSSNGSVISLDVSKMNYYFIDLPSNSAGTLRFGVYGEHGRVIAHEHHFGNNLTTNFMRTASLPLTWQQFNTGVSASPSRMKTTGGAVLNEGFATLDSNVSSVTSSTYYMDTAKTCTGSTFTTLVTARSGLLLSDGVTVNRKFTVPLKLMYHVVGGPVVIQVRVGVVQAGTPSFFRPGLYSPAEIDISGTFPATAPQQGLPIITRIYAPGTYSLDAPETFNIRGSGMSLRSDGQYGTAFSFVIKPVNPTDVVSVNIALDWIDV